MDGSRWDVQLGGNEGRCWVGGGSYSDFIVRFRLKLMIIWNLYFRIWSLIEEVLYKNGARAGKLKLLGLVSEKSYNYIIDRSEKDFSQFGEKNMKNFTTYIL